MLDQEQLIQAARQALAGVLNVSKEATPTVAYEGDRAVVTFPHPSSPGERGPDFDAKVTLDRKSGAVIKILAGS